MAFGRAFGLPSTVRTCDLRPATHAYIDLAIEVVG